MGLTKRSRRTDDRAIVRLHAAVWDAGPMPGYHWTALRQLRNEWPVLYAAIVKLVGEPPQVRE